MGLEAISRGARKVTFVDHNINAIKCVNENIKLLDIKEDYEILKLEDENALSSFKTNNVKFDIIFLDPPYKDGKYEEIITYILNNDLLNPYGIIIAESNRNLLIEHGSITRIKQYKYGEIQVTFFEV